MFYWTWCEWSRSSLRPYPASPDLTQLPHGSSSERQVRSLSSLRPALIYWRGFSMLTPQAADPKLVFLEAPGRELSIGLLPDAVRPLEAKLCRFEVLGSSPPTKKSWSGSPFQRKKWKVACYPSKWFFLVFQAKWDQEMPFGWLFVTTPLSTLAPAAKSWRAWYPIPAGSDTCAEEP